MLRVVSLKYYSPRLKIGRPFRRPREEEKISQQLPALVEALTRTLELENKHQAAEWLNS